MDTVDRQTRSRIMSRIRSRNTRPEVLVRSLLHRRGFRFRIHCGDLDGKPDVVFPRYKAVLFIHGCFWHGHDCPLYRLPKTRTDFWRNKVVRNQSRDKEVIAKLKKQGWRVALLWECSLKRGDRTGETAVDQLAKWLPQKRRWLEIRA